jgi:mono/diheme cytochrome c family protein
MKIKGADKFRIENAAWNVNRGEQKMTLHPLVIASILVLPYAALADESTEGEVIFKAKCQTCHSLNQVQGLLMPKPPAQREAHLTSFLPGHQARLNEAEKKLVITFLSRPDK